MSEGTVELTPERAEQAYFAAQKELRDLYARLKRFEREFVRYSKRKHSDAHVLALAVDMLLGYTPAADLSQQPRPQYAVIRDRAVLIVGIPGIYDWLPDDEGHNCDAMGCNSLEHVIARVPLDSARETGVNGAK